MSSRPVDAPDSLPDWIMPWPAFEVDWARAAWMIIDFQSYSSNPDCGITPVLGPKTSQLSPDYVGTAREIVELATGALSLFFQGAAGNVSPRCGIGSGGAEQFDDLHRIGAMLGGEVVKTWADIRTHNQYGPRRVVQSVAAISVRDYETLPEACLE